MLQEEILEENKKSSKNTRKTPFIVKKKEQCTSSKNRKQASLSFLSFTDVQKNSSIHSSFLTFVDKEESKAFELSESEEDDYDDDI